MSSHDPSPRSRAMPERFERLWGWAYRFEAYTPPAKRVRGYYALPLLWRDEVIGWGNLSVVDGRMQADLGYVSGQAPKEKDFWQALDAELEAMAAFLGTLETGPSPGTGP